MLMDTFGEYLTQILPAKCLGNMKNFRQEYINIHTYRQTDRQTDYEKLLSQISYNINSTGDASDVDVHPQ